MNKFVEIFISNINNLIIGIIAGGTLLIMTYYNSYSFFSKAVLSILVGLSLILVQSVLQYLNFRFGSRSNYKAYKKRLVTKLL